jgi:hypothetical protein
MHALSRNDLMCNLPAVQIDSHHTIAPRHIEPARYRIDSGVVEPRVSLRVGDGLYQSQVKRSSRWSRVSRPCAQQK